MMETTKTDEGCLCWDCMRLAKCSNASKKIDACERYVEFHKYTLEELSVLLHISVRTLHRRIVRCSDQLKKEIEKLGLSVTLNVNKQRGRWEVTNERLCD